MMVGLGVLREVSELGAPGCDIWVWGCWGGAMGEGMQS